MKKLLLSGLAILSFSAINAQVDTLTEFFTGTPTVYGADNSGYVSGNNGYDDEAKMQLFDASHGVSSAGTITNILMWVPIIENAGGTFDVKIWENTAGEPGAELGSFTINIGDVDTSTAGYSVAEGAVAYNVNAMFNVAVPASGEFWAGVILPATAGDTIALVTNTDGDFADAATHSGEFQSGGTFFSYDNGTNATWQLGIANAIFPVINFVAGIDENVITTSVYPNPANDVLNIVASEEIATVSIVALDGKVVANASSSSVNVAELKSGMYIYEVTTTSGKVARDTFMKK